MPNQTSDSSGDARFHETHWSLVIAARKDNARSAEALQTLCQTYWYPLYAFVRREGYSAHDAEDYTQSFLARLIAYDDLASVESQKGRFRSFLLASMKNFLSNEREKGAAQKRGGGIPDLSIDFTDAESNYAIEPAHDLSPDKLFDRRWAMTVLDQATTKLKNEMTAAGKESHFIEMKGFLTGGKGEVRYTEVAEKLSISEAAVKTAVHRLRHRYRALLGDEIAHTVDTKQHIQEELRELLTALSS